MSGIFGIGLSGLSSAKASLMTTSHNIGNVNTPGYHRQRVSQAGQMPSFEGYGYIGRGVEMTAVNRVYNSYLERQLASSTTKDGQYGAQLNTLTQLDDLLGNEKTSLSASLSSMFSAMQAINSSPDSIPARQAAINSMQAFAGQVQLVNNRFEEMRIGVNTQIRSTVGQVNAMAEQIAQINVQIQSMSQSAAVPNDLMDKRDQLVLDLNKLVKADVTVQSDGRYTISIGSGQALVSSGDHFPLEVVESLNDPQKLEIAYAGSNGTVRIPDRLFEGGSLSGLINSKAEALNRSQADLGRLVIEVADQLNRQSGVGRDLYNQPGGDIFKSLNAFRPLPVGEEIQPPTVPPTFQTLETQMKSYRDAAANFSVVISDPSKLAVSSSIKATAVTTPPQPVNPVITSVWQTATGNYEDYLGQAPPGKPPSLPAGGIDLVYDPSITNGPPFIVPAGYTVEASGTAAGSYRIQDGNGLVLDFKVEGMGNEAKTFTIGSKDTGVASPDFTPSDNSNMLELVKIQTKNTMSSTPNGTDNFVPRPVPPAVTVLKTTSFEGFFGQLVSFVGSKTNEIKFAAEAQAVTLKETYLARESFSGVNLDEEAANLIRFQQAYQASSKVIQIAQQIFSDILQMR